MTSLSLAVLLQATAADVGRMLRADALNLTLGFLLLVAALAAAAIQAGPLRGREPSLPWFASFTLGYGTRLLVRTDTVPLIFGLSAALREHLDSALTYVVPALLVLFLRAAFPGPRQWLNASAVFTAAFAAAALAADAVLGRPHAARTPNNLIAIAFLAVALALLFRRGLTPSRELSTLRLGLVSVFLTALVDNLRGLGVASLPDVELEPVGFVVLAACLGTLAGRRLLENRERLLAIDKELGVARRIQESILPREMPNVAGLTIAARYRPMTAVAGDFYDFVEVDERRVGVLVADVSGHGVPAALIASMVKIAVAAQHPHADRPSAVLAGMNQALSGRLGGQYVTAAYLFIDREAGLLRYGGAGHPPLLRGRRGEPPEELEDNGLPLGLMDGADYPQLERPLRAGDRCLLYTDGLFDATNAAGEFFGLDRVKAALVQGAALSADEAVDLLLDRMSDWAGTTAGDDLTIVVVDCA
jgi:sigma-B regulation protein RsbU (phosphoserine phosphatase)